MFFELRSHSANVLSKLWTKNKKNLAVTLTECACKVTWVLNDGLKTLAQKHSSGRIKCLENIQK